jgi:acyl-CoA dehydrogenase
MISFTSPLDSDEIKELSKVVARYSQERADKLANSKVEFRRSDFEDMAKLGLSGMALAEEHGGSNFDALSIAAALFEISRAELGPAVYLSVHMMVSKLISSWTTNEARNELLGELANGKKLGAFALTEASAGSDASALKTRARLDGDSYVLNGEKVYITSSGHADVYLVFARTSDDAKHGISAFIVPSTSDGISFGPHEKKMGCEGSPIASVTFENCKIPKNALLGKEGDGYKIALSGLNGGRVNIAAAACGVAAHALELATAYAQDRKQFGKSISEFQGLRFMLADMAIKLRASIELTRNAAILLDNDNKTSSPASIAKCFATDSAMSITCDAVQIYGGAGYLSDYPVESLMRDAKMLQIVEGTNQIQRLVISREILN